LKTRALFLERIVALALFTGLAAGSGYAAEAKVIYKKKCVACHGATGAPAPPFAKRGVRDLSDPAWQKGASDDEIRKVITEGSEGTLMRSFKKELSKEEIASLVTFVRTLKRNQ
jgi:cytochrome c oxidase cbb3-type subunit 3